MNRPAGTACAVVRVVSGNFVPERFAQSAARATSGAAAMMRLRAMRLHTAGTRIRLAPSNGHNGPGLGRRAKTAPSERKSGGGLGQLRNSRVSPTNATRNPAEKACRLEGGGTPELQNAEA